MLVASFLLLLLSQGEPPPAILPQGVEVGGYAWGGVGDKLQPIGDHDGDGTADYAWSRRVYSGPPRDRASWLVAVTIEVFSGAGGRKLAEYAVDPSCCPDHALGCVWTARLIGDVDGDGTQELVVGAMCADNYRGRVQLLSEQPCRILWTREGSNRGAWLGSGLAVVGDIDGDAVQDVLATAPSSSLADTARGEGALWALSGRTGRVLYTHAGGTGLGTSVATLDDVDGDGVLEVVVSAARTGAGQGCSARVGATGDVLWTWEPPAPRLHVQALTSVADATGDGVRDVLLAVKGYEPYRDALCAVSGATGESLWSLDLPATARSLQSLGDLDGDRLDELAVATADEDVLVLSSCDGSLAAVVRPDGVTGFGEAVVGIPGRRLLVGFTDWDGNLLDNEGGYSVYDLRPAR